MQSPQLHVCGRMKPLDHEQDWLTVGLALLLPPAHSIGMTCQRPTPLQAINNHFIPVQTQATLLCTNILSKQNIDFGLLILKMNTNTVWRKLVLERDESSSIMLTIPQLRAIQSANLCWRSHLYISTFTPGSYNCRFLRHGTDSVDTSKMSNSSEMQNRASWASIFIIICK